MSKIPDNPFTKRYQALDNSELLEIIDFPEDFQPLAVDAARLEIESRQLTPEQLSEARTKQRVTREIKAKEENVLQKAEDKLNSLASQIVDTIHPIQTGVFNTDKQIMLMAFFLVALCLYQVYGKLGLLIYMFSDPSASWDVYTLLYLVPLLLLPAIAVLWWLRKKLGWMLAMIFFSNTAAGAVPSLLRGFNYEPSGIPVLDSIFPVPSPLYFFGTLLIYGGLAATLSRENIKVVYKIDKRSMFTALGIGVGLVLLMTFFL